MRQPILQVLFGIFICLLRAEETGVGQRFVIEFIEHNAIAAKIDKEIAALFQQAVHVSNRMHDEIHRCLEFLLMREPVCRFLPIGGEIGELDVVDDHEHIEIRTIRLFRMWLVDPATAGIRSEQDDFEDAAALFKLRSTALQCIRKLFAQHFDSADELTLFERRQMVDAGLSVVE